jgi:hypothetical protein
MRGRTTGFDLMADEALPESLCDSATAVALQDIIDLDLDAIAAVQPPLGYGGD